MPDVSNCSLDVELSGHLIAALLSVNSYALEKAQRVSDELHKGGLVDLTKFCSLEEKDIVSKLRLAGYDRGEFMTQLIASRLANLGRHITAIGVGRVNAVLASGDRDAVTSLL